MLKKTIRHKLKLLTRNQATNLYKLTLLLAILSRMKLEAIKW